jgi:hypothetical protein
MCHTPKMWNPPSTCQNRLILPRSVPWMAPFVPSLTWILEGLGATAKNRGRSVTTATTQSLGIRHLHCASWVGDWRQWRAFSSKGQCHRCVSFSRIQEQGLPPLGASCVATCIMHRYIVIPDFSAKTKYSSYVCPGSIIPHIWTKSVHR